jgi:signal transduction histidine kinase
MTEASAGNDVPIRRLLEIGRALASDLDADAILRRVLDAAMEVTGARYAALGVLDETRNELAQFYSAGIDADARRAIGGLPRGRGVLGALISDPRPLRLANVSDDPRSYGFPGGHPRMATFLGVPVMIRGQAWGNLYLTDKRAGGEFTAEDQEAAVILSEWAGAAIQNARVYERSEQRREQLEQAVRGLEATRDIAMAISSVTRLDHVLELIVKRGRALVDARAVLIMLRQGADLVVAASAGYAQDVRGHRVPVADSTSGQVLERGRPERIADVTSRLRITPSELGVSDAHTALLVPMILRGRGIGVLAAFDRGARGAPFTESDEQLLTTFGATAANAVALARSVEADRLRSSMAAADAERRRWARELHDDTLQVFGGLRVLLSGTLRRGNPSRYEPVMRDAVEAIEQGIESLRTIIADLRPAALDELGLRPALDALLERRRNGGMEIEAELELPEPGIGERALDPELETTIYRLVQEALTNVVKHAHARTVRVSVLAGEDEIAVEVHDDGVGFDTQAAPAGFGLAGMRERVYLADGTFEIDSGEDGTLVRSRLATRWRDGAGTTPAPQRAAS